MVLSGFNKSDKSYFQSVAQLLGAIVISARSTTARADVLVAKRSNTSNAIAALNSGTPVVRSDWLMACWAQAARVPTTKFAWGVDNDDDDDDNDDATLLTQRPTLRTHTANIRPTTSKLNAPNQLHQHQSTTTNGVARSVNDSMFSLNRLKKTATSWWSRFVGDAAEQEQAPPVTIEVVDDESRPPSPILHHLNEDNERPSSTTSIDDIDLVEIDDRAPTSPAHPAVELSFQFVDIESSQSVSQAVGAATQQALALSQRFLPCLPVQFDDFAATQRVVEPRRTFNSNDDDDGEAKTQRRTDIHYGLPRSHKRLRADLLGEEFHEPAAPVVPKDVIVVEPIEVIVVEDESPTKRARKEISKKPADEHVPPRVASAEVADSDSPWASDVYDGASQLDFRCQLVTRELEHLKAIEKEQKAIENEKKAGKQRRALKKLSVVALSPINAKTAGHRRRTRRRKISHTKQ